MIENQEQLVHSQQQLVRLRGMEERVIGNFNRHPRLKKSELAGIRSMITQIEREIRIYNLSRLQSSVNELEEQAQNLSVAELPALLSQKIRVIREATAAMQPVI